MQRPLPLSRASSSWWPVYPPRACRFVAVVCLLVCFPVAISALYPDDWQSLLPRLEEKQDEHDNSLQSIKKQFEIVSEELRLLQIEHDELKSSDAEQKRINVELRKINEERQRLLEEQKRDLEQRIQALEKDRALLTQQSEQAERWEVLSIDLEQSFDDYKTAATGKIQTLRIIVAIEAVAIIAILIFKATR